MKLSIRQLKKIIKEAIIDTVSNKLPEIFDENERLIPEVRNTIITAIESLKQWLRQNHPELQVTQVFVVGAAITYQYGPGSDIDVSVVIPGLGSKRSVVNNWMEKNLVYPNFEPGNGISRPYQFKPMEDNNNYLNADAAYDPFAQKFLKKTDREQAQSMYDKRMFADSYENKMYDSLEQILQTNFKELYDTITTSQDSQEIKQNIISTYKRKKVLKDLRSASYNQNPDTGFVSQNWGSSNVVYKMLDRSGYLDIFNIIEPVAKYNSPVTPDLLSDLKDSLEVVINDEIGWSGANYEK